MTYLRNIFCCDAVTQLSSIDTVAEVVRLPLHQRTDKDSHMSTLEFQQRRASSLLLMGRSKPSSCRDSQPVHLAPISFNKGDEGEPEGLYDSDSSSPKIQHEKDAEQQQTVFQIATRTCI